MTEGGLLLTILLMYIGAASGSTGGGIKVNTFAVLTAAVVSAVRGKERVTVFGSGAAIDPRSTARSPLPCSPWGSSSCGRF